MYIKKLRYWTQKILPQVYDDSLSYSELLSKVVAYLNDTIEQVNENTETLSKVSSYTDNLAEFSEISNDVTTYLMPTVEGLQTDVELLNDLSVLMNGDIRNNFPQGVESKLDPESNKRFVTYTLVLNDGATGWPVGVNSGIVMIARDLRDIYAEVTVIDQRGRVFNNRYNYNNEVFEGWRGDSWYADVNDILTLDLSHVPLHGFYNSSTSKFNVYMHLPKNIPSRLQIDSMTVTGFTSYCINGSNVDSSISGNISPDVIGGNILSFTLPAFVFGGTAPTNGSPVFIVANRVRVDSASIEPLA